MKENPEVALKLKLESWMNLFHVLHELGLGRMTPQREAAYHAITGEHFTEGNFWGAIHALEAQIGRLKKSRASWRRSMRTENSETEIITRAELDKIPVGECPICKEKGVECLDDPSDLFICCQRSKKCIARGVHARYVIGSGVLRITCGSCGKVAALFQIR